ncbi:raffinose/stachyose/melibiose transport system permease protein [Cohnella sp. OV330]|uniref:carbohydrate ABC transporter permease n=1 Tax=Cohnella sp. OV330 TaxID=1855288 RepID=UPI0008E8D88C|nr:sugar ABC transporter permease [Cohnella sp. OV330]SFB06005.1 raffinose/stachyose/melibiose transport system permease protein [Cohnella sp. OV330]
MRSRSMSRYYSAWFVMPAFILFLVFFILPNIASFVLGFTDWSLFYFDDIRFNGLDNFERLFTEANFLTAIKNTFYFAILTVIVKNVLGFLLALLVHKPSRYNNYLRSVIFLPITISSIVVAIVFVAIYNPSNGILNEGLRAVGLGGLANDWLFDPKIAMTSISFMEVWQWTGFNMCIFIAGLQSISKEYYEAASIDGASKFKQTLHITLPLLMQSINITVIFSIISGLKVFAQVYGTTNGGPADATQVLGTFLYKSFGQGYLGYSSAVGLVTTAIIMILTLGILAFLRKREVEY